MKWEMFSPPFLEQKFIVKMAEKDGGIEWAAGQSVARVRGLGIVTNTYEGNK